MMSKFLFTVPKPNETLSEAANVALAMGAMSSRLVSELRTRCTHPDSRRENVAEHSLMVVKVAVALAQRFYQDLDAGKVAMFASMHDDVEAYVGDTPTDAIGGKPDYSAKAEREKRGLRKLIEDYHNITPQYAHDMEEYEAQQCPEARFVRLVDKLTVILIHIPNQLAELRPYYSRPEDIVADNEKIVAKFRQEYPEFPELNDLRIELARYVATMYL